MTTLTSITPPPWPQEECTLLAKQIASTGQDDRSILTLGLWNVPTPHKHVRLFAGYRYLHRHPEDHAAWLQLVEAHRELGEYDEAEIILNALETESTLDLFPQVFYENIVAHRALLLTDRQDYDKAFVLFDELADAFTDHPLYHYLRASLWHAQDDYDKAVDEYDCALTNLEVYLSQTDLLDDAVDYEGVAAAITQQKQRAEEQDGFCGYRPAEMGELAHATDPGDMA